MPPAMLARNFTVAGVGGSAVLGTGGAGGGNTALGSGGRPWPDCGGCNELGKGGGNGALALLAALAVLAAPAGGGGPGPGTAPAGRRSPPLETGRTAVVGLGGRLVLAEEGTVGEGGPVLAEARCFLSLLWQVAWKDAAREADTGFLAFDGNGRWNRGALLGAMAAALGATFRGAWASPSAWPSGSASTWPSGSAAAWSSGSAAAWPSEAASA